ncbi:MAG: TonB-dependent receptor plug domain-containing protein [Undibacterium sp.]|nr:TonB-dependent receptor plug domain-containing protein [Opitutaceae bacterium]
MLNPFTVETARDRGYAAASTLAGTRLNTPLRDVGASISVYTKNLFNDLGATHHNDLLIYATGIEAGGPGGNFSNGANDINDPSVVGDGSRTSPQTQWRTRGLAAPNATRGFFVSDIAGDAYNTEAITVSRGPNAILFGVGSPAGVVDTTLIRPDLARDSSRVDVRYGDNDSLRDVIDFNRVLIPQKLAFRLAALRDDERFDQRPAYENKRRVFGTVAYEPFRTTAFRASFESGSTRANRPFQVLPFDSISPQWKAAGRLTWDWNYYDDPARNPDAVNIQANDACAASPARFFVGQAQIFGGFATPYTSGEARTPDYGFRSTVPTGGGTNAVRSGLYEPNVNRDAAFDAVAFYEAFNLAEIPGGYYADNRRPAGIKYQGLCRHRFPWTRDGEPESP